MFLAHIFVQKCWMTERKKEEMRVLVLGRVRFNMDSVFLLDLVEFDRDFSQI